MSMKVSLVFPSSERTASGGRPMHHQFRIHIDGNNIELSWKNTDGDLIRLSMRPNQLVFLKGLVDAALDFVASSDPGKKSWIERVREESPLNQPDENGYLQVGFSCMYCGRYPEFKESPITVEKGLICSECRNRHHPEHTPESF